MIIVSLILVVVAAVVLIAGIFQGGLELVYISIVSALAAMVLLGLGVLARRRAAPQGSNGAYGPGASAPTSPAGGATAAPPRPRAPERPTAADDADDGGQPDTTARDDAERRVVRSGADDRPTTDVATRSADAWAAEAGERRSATSEATSGAPDTQRSEFGPPPAKKAVRKKVTRPSAGTTSPAAGTTSPAAGTSTASGGGAAVAPSGSDASSNGTDARAALRDIRGLGPTKQRALLEAYPSLEAISAASVDELSQVKGIGPSVAQRVKDALR